MIHSLRIYVARLIMPREMREAIDEQARFLNWVIEKFGVVFIHKAYIEKVPFEVEEVERVIN